MSIYDKSSLVLIPSGTKTSKVYSQKPTNGDGDFDFTRSTAATRIAANGNIEKETGNLLLQSNSFDTTWVTANASVTGGQSGYDGSSDAWLLQNNAGFTTTANVRQNLSLGSSVRSFSVYAKQGNVDWMRILMYDGSIPHQCWFNLTDGSTANASDIIDSKSTSVGGGWYRCEILANTNIESTNIYPTSVAGSSFSDNGGNILIQDAQLEQGLVARDYIETTTTALYGGITDNVPRLDYTDSSCPALLLEPQRTNVLTNSEYVGGMTLQNISATANATTSPEGVGNAYEVEPTGTGFKTIGNFVSVTANLTYTISFFYKNVDHKNIGFYDNNTSGSEIQINVQDNTFTLGSNVINGNVEDYGNGWYRAYATFAASSGTLANYLIFRNDSNSGSYTATGSSIYVYGFQVESGSYKTSYIPTYGTSVTRNADSCLGAGNASTFNSTEGVLYWEGSFDSTSTTAGAIALIGANSNRVQFYNSGSNVVALITPNGSTSFTATTSGSVDITSNHKYAVKWSLNDFALWVDGVKIATDTSGATFNNDALTELRFSDFGANYLYANVKQVLTFNTALSDAELATLTTI
jgi:hypothetical protein